MKFFLITLALLLTIPAFTCSPDGKIGFVPDTDLVIGPKAIEQNNMTESQFHQAIDKVERVYRPIMKSHGYKLKLLRHWESETVNAYASGRKRVRKIKIKGGIARHKDITPDGLSLIVCHEFGHHLGGAPKKMGRRSWASTDGQADYFATLKCLRKAFVNEDNKRVLASMNIPFTVRSSCNQQFRNSVDIDICMRSSMAAMSVSNMLYDLKLRRSREGMVWNPPSFEVTDPSVVTATSFAHPLYSCRKDTMYQGALCSVPMHLELSNKDETKGVCHPANGHTVGNRPLCWFKPQFL